MSSRAVIAEFIDYSDPFRPSIKISALISIMNERDKLREFLRTKELSLELQILEHEVEKKAREKAEKGLSTWEEFLKMEGIERAEDLSDRLKALKSLAEEFKSLMEWQRKRADSAEGILRIVAGGETMSRIINHERPM